jgi:subtilisin-like proprotein convertase family protein
VLRRAAILILSAGAAAHAQTLYSYAGAPVAIPDSPTGNCGPEAVAEILVRDSFEIDAVQVGFFIPHPWQGDVKVVLTHVETGTTVTLVNRPGSPDTLIGFGASNYGAPGNPMQLTDLAGEPYATPAVAPPGISGVAGPWRPVSPLAAFRRQNALGTWRLRAQDCAGLDTGTITAFSLWLTPATSCYANCDRSVSAPALNIADFTCFLQRFAQGCPGPGACYANCDGSTQAPILTIADLTCFLTQYAQGCTAP